MLTRAEAEAIALQAAGYPQHDPDTRARLKAAAARKHEREAEDFAAFAAIDQGAYTGRIQASVISAPADLETARDAGREAERKAGEALKAERAAQDRAREHAEGARKAQETWTRVQGRGTHQEQTAALIASRLPARWPRASRPRPRGNPRRGPWLTGSSKPPGRGSPRRRPRCRPRRS